MGKRNKSSVLIAVTASLMMNMQGLSLSVNGCEGLYWEESSGISGFTTENGVIVENCINLEICNYRNTEISVTGYESIAYPDVNGKICFGEVVYPADQATLWYPDDPENWWYNTFDRDKIPVLSATETLREDGMTVATIWGDVPETGIPQDRIVWVTIVPVNEEVSFNCSVFGYPLSITGSIHDAEDTLPEELLSELHSATEPASEHILPDENETETNTETTPTETENITETSVTTTSETVSAATTISGLEETDAVESDENSDIVSETETIASETHIVTTTSLESESIETSTTTCMTEPIVPTESDTETANKYSIFDINKDGKVNLDDLFALLTMLFQN